MLLGLMNSAQPCADRSSVAHTKLPPPLNPSNAFTATSLDTGLEISAFLHQGCCLALVFVAQQSVWVCEGQLGLNVREQSFGNSTLFLYSCQNFPLLANVCCI